MSWQAVVLILGLAWAVGAVIVALAFVAAKQP